MCLGGKIFLSSNEDMLLGFQVFLVSKGVFVRLDQMWLSILHAYDVLLEEGEKRSLLWV